MRYQHEGTGDQSPMLYRLMMESRDTRPWSRDDYDDVSVDVAETSVLLANKPLRSDK
jgi:hypothetical protein